MNVAYNVFISWSGERSRVIARKLRDWLPMVVQAARPWMSDADIKKGSRGLNEITKALYTPKVGIICLTPENLETPWLFFEAGALSKAIDDTNRVCTYLLGGLEPEDVKPPMGMFQATRPTKEDSKKLVRTINSSISTDPLREEALDEVFEAMWPSLESAIKGLPSMKPPKAMKRTVEDMLAEILELVRAQAGRWDTHTISASVMDIIRAEALRQSQKFLASLLDHVTHWSVVQGEIHLYFPAEERALMEMLRSSEPLQKLQDIAGAVLGRPTRIVVDVIA
jgi:hypothetical protein